MRCEHCFFIVTVLYVAPVPSRIKVCGGCFYEIADRLPYPVEIARQTKRRVRDVELFGEWSS